MERLSFSPYAVKRLNPASDQLAFTINDSTARNITGMTLEQLFSAGRLFYADYRSQRDLPKTNTGKYAAACDGYFYIDQKSGDFLPLAIRTNVGSNLIYTPADTANDWLLAKLMYNINDVWFSQWNHLAQTHEVVQIIYMAAIRTLSESHPVRAILDRLMYEIFGIQPLALVTLFAPGALVDQNFAYTGGAAESYSNNLYTSGAAGAFQSNYFMTDVLDRGLVNSSFGPPLKSFPWYEDASRIHSAQTDFMTSFVNSYYTSAQDISKDTELQNWVSEANSQAKVIDFPAAPISTTSTLINILTQMAHLVSTAHHTANTDSLLNVAAVFPLHLNAIFRPVPTAKGVQNVVDYMPSLENCISQTVFAALFSRYDFQGTNRTLIHSYDDSAMLGRLNTETRQAAATFMSSMRQFSGEVESRAFDANGLSQGMPFIWKALDPNLAPYSITI